MGTGWRPRKRRGADKRQRQKLVGVRLVDAEYEAIKSAAYRKGVSPGALLRDAFAENRQLRAEVAQFRKDARDALLVVTVLIRKLGGHALIADADLAVETGALIRFPEMGGYSLTIKDGPASGGPRLDDYTGSGPGQQGGER
jgi:hypothetical protein